MTLYTLYVLGLLVSIVIALLLLWRLWPLRPIPGAWSLILSILAVAVWSLGYALEIVSPDLAGKLLWAKIEYIGIALVPLSIFIFGLQYSGRGKWLRRRNVIALAVIPLLTISLAFTNEAHRLIWTTIKTQRSMPIAPLLLDHGWWFWVHLIFSYLLLLLTTYFLFRLTLQAHSLYRAQAGIILAGTLIPWVGNILYFAGLVAIDLTPLAFTLTNLALVIGFARYRLLDIIPVALDSIFKAMRDGVVVLDQKGRVVEFNPAAQRMFNQSGTLRLGGAASQLFPDWPTGPDSVDADPEPQREVRLGEGKDERIYSRRVAPVLNRRGQSTGRLVMLTDITDLKRTEDQVRLQITALEAAENGIVITDARGNIQWANLAFTRLTGYAREEVLGQNPRVLKSGEHPPEFYKDLWETILAGRVWRGEMRNRRKDGMLYFEEMTITPLRQPDGAITHFIAVKQDISARKLAEATQRQAHQEAVEANRLKTQLLANVSHDLRTPLGAIMGFADMLRSGVYGEMNPPQSEAAAEILDSANQLLAFVNNLIGQAQLETGKVMLKVKPFEPAELTDAVHSAASLLTKKKGLALEVVIDPALPPRLRGDAYWLRQVLLNLVNNAVKFTEHGSVMVRLFSPDAAHWALQVTDTGPGIPPDAQAAIFEPFRQVDGSATRKHGGSGLGLSIVKELTALMGGTIELDSQMGRGSTFTVILPMLNPEEKTL